MRNILLVLLVLVSGNARAGNADIPVLERTVDPKAPVTQLGLDFGPGEIALTFDDGPDFRHTPKILALLAKYGVRAGFFLIGENAEKYPEIVRDMVEGQHSVGTHTFTHANIRGLYKRNHAAAWTEVQGAVDSLARITEGRALPFFRFPMIANNSETIAMVHGKGLVDFEYNIESVGAVQRATEKKPPSGIMIFHDARPNTVAEVELLLEVMAKRHYRAVVFTVAP